MLILHTTLFAPQTSDLDATDLSIAWSLLHMFKTAQMVIYNCGVESGSSQGHKHLQIFPRMDGEDFEMWPNQVVKDNESRGSPCLISRVSEALSPYVNLCIAEVTGIPHIPFKHFIDQLPTGADAQHVFRIYQRLLRDTKSALREAGAGTDYNLILVPEWLVLIPRRSRGSEPIIINAANMAGLMWVKNGERRNQVLDMGVAGLAKLGIPIEKISEIPS